MSLRAKLISTVSAFVLVLALMTMGIYAVLTQSVNLGGNISFQAQDVQATISKGIVDGGTLADADNKLQAITLDAGHDGKEQIATWSNLDLSFAESGEDVTITFDITNNHPEKALLVEMTPNSGSADNATMTVTSTSGDVESIIIGAKGESEAQKATYVVTFHIIDKNKSASISNFNIDINLSLTEAYTTTIICYNDGSGPISDPSWGWYTDNGHCGGGEGSYDVTTAVIVGAKNITFWCGNSNAGTVRAPSKGIINITPSQGEPFSLYIGVEAKEVNIEITSDITFTIN